MYLVSPSTMHKMRHKVIFKQSTTSMGSVCDVIVIAIENGHYDLSSNPRWGYLHFP